MTRLPRSGRSFALSCGCRSGSTLRYHYEFRFRCACAWVALGLPASMAMAATGEDGKLEAFFHEQLDAMF